MIDGQVRQVDAALGRGRAGGYTYKIFFHNFFSHSVGFLKGTFLLSCDFLIVVVAAVAGQRPRHLLGRRAGVLLQLQHHREAAL